LKNLKKMLEEAVLNEEYEKAVAIRDEISKRQ
jgi:protein-arginine kinase activator protein McsA